MFKQTESPSFIDITVVHIAVYLLIPVLLGNNRLRAFISASFAFSVINLTHLPVMYLILFVLRPFINSLSYVDFLQQNPQIYYGGIIFTNIVIAACCFFAARWLRKTSTNPPIKIYALFNILFILFPVMVLVWYEDILAVMSTSFLASFFMSALFLGIILFLFYLYTRLARGNHTDELRKTTSPLPLTASEGEKYAPFIQQLSKRELEVVETVLAGNVSYKEISSALNISVHTVKAHLQHIYKTTGVSNVAALSSLFRGFTLNNHQ